MHFDPYWLQSLSTLEWPIVFFGAIIFGDAFILSCGYVAGQGLWSAWDIFWLALVGTIVSDLLWFWFGPYALRQTHRWKKMKDKHQKLVVALQHYTGRRPFLALVVIKFLYGTRILTIVYLSSIRVRFSTFLMFDILGTGLWLVVMLGVGWLAGQGIANLIPAVQNVEYVLTGVVAVAIVYQVVSTWLERYIDKKL